MLLTWYNIDTEEHHTVAATPFHFSMKGVNLFAPVIIN